MSAGAVTVTVLDMEQAADSFLRLPPAAVVTLQKAIRLLKSTETVVRTYERTKLWREAPAMYQREWLPQHVPGACSQLEVRFLHMQQTAQEHQHATFNLHS